MTNRDELQRMLERLDHEVTAGLRDNPDRDAFWPAFAAQSDKVLEAAGDEHFGWVSRDRRDAATTRHPRPRSLSRSTGHRAGGMSALPLGFLARHPCRKSCIVLPGAFCQTR